MSQHDFTEAISTIRQQIIERNVAINELRDIIERYMDLQEVLKELLQNARRVTIDRQKQEDITNLLRHFVTNGKNVSDLVDKLKALGYSLRLHDSPVKSDFESQAYRIMELARMNRREEVCYAITRIFIAHRMPVPKPLAETFKPIYSDQVFKVLVYSFLGSICGDEKSEQQQNEEQSS